MNDKLVQDEIVSTTTGNVKEYTKVAVTPLSNGQTSVTIKATISINKLISYAKSKGSRAEFAGQAFSANLKLMQLRATSTKKTIELMLQQLDKIAEDMFDFKIDLGDPSKKDGLYYFKPQISIYSNVASTNFHNQLFSTLDALQLSNEDRQFCSNSGIPNTYCMYEPFFIRKNGYKEERVYYTLPLSGEESRNYWKKLHKILIKGYTHFVISEIGNPKNQYTCIQEKPKEIKGFTYEYAYIRGTKVPGGYNSATKQGNTNVYVSNLWVQPQYNKVEVNPSFCLKEEKMPVNLAKSTSKQQKTVKNDKASPQLVMEFKTQLPVSAIDLESGRFQGFEIKSK